MKINLTFEMSAEEITKFVEGANKANVSSEVLRLLRKVQDNDFERAAKESKKLFKKNFLDEDFSKDFNAEYEKTRRELEEAQKRFDVRHEQNMKALEELEHELKGLQ